MSEGDGTAAVDVLAKDLSPEDLQQLLEASCAAGDLGTVETILQTPEGRLALLTKGASGRTAMHACLGTPSMEEMLLLLLKFEEGRQAATWADCFGGTALHRCCMAGCVRAVKELLQIPDVLQLVNATTHSQGTPLHFACRGNKVEVAALLLATEEGKKALQLHCGKDTGAALSTPLFIAAAIPTGAPLVRMILDLPEGRAGLAAHGSQEQLATVLHLAARNGNADVIREIVRHKEGAALALELDKQGCTPLYVACTISSPNAVKALLEIEEGKQSLFIGGRNATPLYAACVAKDDATALALLEEPATAGLINQSSGIGGGPMHRACSRGFFRVVEKMLEFDEGRQAITSKDTAGWTPLHIASSIGCAKSVGVLLNTPEGRDCLAWRTNTKAFPLELACEAGNSDVVERILAETEAAELLAQPNPSTMRTVVHAACSPLDSRALQVLLEFPEGRAAALLQDEKGWTPLHLAADEGRHKHATLLLQACDGDELAMLTSKKGETALHVALRREEKDVALAIISETTPRTWTIRDENGKSPQDVASQSGLPELASILAPRVKGALC